MLPALHHSVLLRRLRVFLASAILCGVFAQQANAQPDDGLKDTVGLAAACVEIREHVLEYAEETIYPSLLDIRDEFTANVSDSDRVVLQTLRTDWQRMLRDLQATHAELSSLREMDAYEDIAANRRRMRVLLNMSRELRWEMKELMTRNPDAGDALDMRLSAGAGKWQGGLMNFFVKWNAEHQPLIMAAMETQAVTPLSDFLRAAMTFHFGQPIDDAPQRFLLWDGEDFITPMRNARSLFTGHPLVLPFDERQLIILKGVYPNPFAAEATVQLLLPEPGPLTVTLRDLDGNEQRQVFRSHAEAGEHRLPLKGDGLAEGMYVVEVIFRDLYDAVAVTHGAQ